MRKQLSMAVVVLAAVSHIARAADESLGPAENHPAPLSASQYPQSPPLEQSAPLREDFEDLETEPLPGALCAKAGWVCDRPKCFWVRGEFLWWSIKDAPFPPLVTTGVPGATALPGVLGQPGTRTLFGDNDIDYGDRSGGRFTAGFWLNKFQTIGLEGSYFFLAPGSVYYDDNSALIARPFFDVIRGTENAQLVAFPGIATGQIHLSTSSRLQGAELNLLCAPCQTPCEDPCDNAACPTGKAGHKDFGNPCGGHSYSVTMLGGFRYLHLDEDLNITETSQVNPALPAGPPLFGGSTITVDDQFATNNHFYGGQIGARAESCWGRAFVNVTGKVALGVTHQIVDIQGQTVNTAADGTSVTTPAGFLATGSNSGQHTRDAFAVVPEVAVNVGYQLTRHLRASVGYTFMYWSLVARPGDQVDLGLSGTEIPTDSRFNPGTGPARPTALLGDTDFWAQGLNAGMEFRY